MTSLKKKNIWIGFEGTFEEAVKMVKECVGNR